jgi:glutamate racemase
MALEVKNTLTKMRLIKKSDNISNEHKFIVSDKNRISEKFLEHGRKFLNLEELNFKEENIFTND